mmetsp:Transcript_40516/g.128700  ORF Transcript_40516/g.128700 Transcript_40516/m.128700 type:complete len:89 (+) Transcript_40516:46-312(+)
MPGAAAGPLGGLRHWLAVALLGCCARGAAGLGENPACWINWVTTEESADGEVTEGDACMILPSIMILNVAFFYVLFWFFIKTLILSTQ